MSTPADLCRRFSLTLADLPCANSAAKPKGIIRQNCADFDVTETLTFEPSGEGEHLFLYIEKSGCNTQWVADQLQRYFKLRSQDVGYAGKKDRHSISRQWFSLHLPGREVDLETLKQTDFRVLKSIRHNKKLRKGVIKTNHFKIKLSQLSSSPVPTAIEEIKQNGFPNYFGYQRFGHQASNLVKAEQFFRGEIRVRSRNKRGIYLSAARSYLFNMILAERIKQSSWDQLLSGDCLMLAGSQSYFVCEQPDADTQQRLFCGDLNVSGWLAGDQPSQASLEAEAIEQSVIQAYSGWLEGLQRARVKSARRSLRVVPENFKLTPLDSNNLVIEFSLPTGSFATSLLRELFVVEDASRREV